VRSSFKSLLDRPLGGGIRLDWERALYITLIVLALATRLWGLGVRVQSHDESLHTKYSWNLYAGQGFQHTPLMHGPFLFHATALSYFLFGDNDFTARLFVALMGVAVVAFPYLFRRWFGRAGALCASFFLLISPSIAYYSRYIRHDLPVILWALVVIFAVFSYLRDGRQRWLYLMAAGISLSFATKEVAFIYNAIIGFFLVGLFARQSLSRDWGRRERLKSWLGLGLVVIAVGLLILSLGLLSGGSGEAAGEEGGGLPWWGFVGGALAAGAAMTSAAVLVLGTWQDLRGPTSGRRDRYLHHRSFDLIIVLGTLCLPFLSPILIELGGLDPVDYTAPTIYYSGAITGFVLAISAVIGLLWNWRQWSIVAAIHYAIFLVFFTTVFTNGSGIASGMVGSMGYWLAQQGVKRGDQPWYYYGVILPMYDYLPLLLTLLTGGFLLVRSAVTIFGSSAPDSCPSEEAEAAQGREAVSDLLDVRRLFTVFLLWWTVLAWITYSYAGEKMPWLTVHLALPMILLGAWGMGRFLERMDWQKAVRERLWIVALLAPPFAMALGTLVQAVSRGPFRGDGLTALTVTGQFLGSLIGTLAFGAGLMYAIQWQASGSGTGDSANWRVAVQVVLLVTLLIPVGLTMRHAWHFCYINYSYPIEHLVYAHAGPAVRDTMRQIEELSRRVVGGPKQIKVAYGADGSWPFHWYLRDYENAVFYGEEATREQMDAPVVIAGREQWETVAPYVANDYIANTYTFLWWPMEDYKNLTWQRIRGALTNPEMRRALWSIWYDRDYDLYDEVMGKNHNLDEWPLRSEYRLYVRRDTVAQMWDRGTLGPGALTIEEPYADNQLTLTARAVFGEQGSGRGEFQSPRGIAIGDDGLVYVADAGNHRVQVFSGDGGFEDSWGVRSLAEEESGRARGFNEPWDVAVGLDGYVYVADTWNHRIQKLDSEGVPVAAWGTFGEARPDDGAAGQGLFYGPRGVAVSEAPARAAGAVYVTDTGNKRVQVLEVDGDFALQWGGGGAAEGNLDEPVGIALGPDGDIYVADTWNRRIQVFDRAGAPLRQWPIRGWDSSIPEEKPYLAVDDEGHVYVTDPGRYRVLVFDSQGNYLLSFGEYGTDSQSFSLPQGIAVAPDGSVYVTDAHAHRVLIFDPIDFDQLEE